MAPSTEPEEKIITTNVKNLVRSLKSMWTFLANPLQETVRTNVIQHKILNNTYLHRFLCSKVESYHTAYVHNKWALKSIENV